MDSSLKDTNLFLLKRSRDLLRRNAEYKEVESSAKKTYLSLNDAVNVGDDDVCIVTNDLPPTDQRVFVQYLAEHVRKDSSKVYVYAGYRFNYTKNGSITPVQKITRFDRRPFVARYKNNDNKEELVDVFTGETFACSGRVLNDILGIKQSGTSNEVISVACAKLDIPIVCILPKRDWSGQPSRKSSNEVIAVFDTDEHSTVFSYKGWGKEKKFDVLPLAADVMAERPADPESVAVIMTTHNRTETAKITIESLVKRLKYPKLHWFIADDRSDPGHVQQLVDKFAELGVNDVNVTETDSEHWGLGASLNNALSAAFRLTDVVLTTEDDWYLQYDFDISECVDVLKSDTSVCTIRLGTAHCLFDYLEVTDNPDFCVVNTAKYNRDENKKGNVLSLQVALRHRRLFDLVGMYQENKHPDIVEKNMNSRYCAQNKLKVLWPSYFSTKSLVNSTNPFVHFGESTVGHEYFNSSIATAFSIIHASEAREHKTSTAEYAIDRSSGIKSPFFRVIIPVHNTVEGLKRAIGSIASQTYTDYVVSVCDDGSENGAALENEKTVQDLLGNQGIFTRHDTVKYAGAARNTAVEAAPDSEYTLFLDADDNFTYDDFFKDLKEFAVKHGLPDAIPLPFVNNAKQHLYDTMCVTTPAELALKCVAPWRKAIRTAVLRPFNTGLRKSNDVVQHMRQCDNVETVVPFNKICVSYNDDGDTTTFGKNKKKNTCTTESVRSIFRVCADVLDETYKHEYMRAAVQKQIMYKIEHMIPETLKLLGKDGIGSIVRIENKT